MPGFRPKALYGNAGLQSLDLADHLPQARRPCFALTRPAPVLANNVLGPGFLYRNFTKLFQHVKVHRSRAGTFELAIMRPLRDDAPISKGLKVSLILPQPFGGGSVETTWSASVFARDGHTRASPKACNRSPGSGSGGEKSHNMTTTISQHIHVVNQRHSFTINQTCNMHIINRNRRPPGARSPVAPCRRQCKPESTARCGMGIGRGRRTSPDKCFLQNTGAGVGKDMVYLL